MFVFATVVRVNNHEEEERACKEDAGKQAGQAAARRARSAAMERDQHADDESVMNRLRQNTISHAPVIDGCHQQASRRPADGRDDHECVARVCSAEDDGQRVDAGRRGVQARL
jgi:hypothetical protein